MGWRQLEILSEILAARHCSKKQFQPSLRPPAAWYRQINSLQGYQKRGSVIHVPPSFRLSVNLHTNLPIRPVKPSTVLWPNLQSVFEEVRCPFFNRLVVPVIMELTEQHPI